MPPHGRRNNVGRPVEVQGGQRRSILFGARELRILAHAQRQHLGSVDNTSLSRIIRLMVRTCWADRREDLQDLWRNEMTIQDLQDRLARCEADRQRAEERLNARRGKKESTLNRLLAETATVQRLVESGHRGPSEHALLNQVWHNRAQDSWPRVLELLELARQQQAWPPKEAQ